MLSTNETMRLRVGRPKAAKTSILCTWIIKAMEPGESNLQLMLKYRLARFNPQGGRGWGINMDWFTNKSHTSFIGSKVWGHISKAWNVMVRGIYQLPPRTLIELLHSSILWSEGIEFINNGFSQNKALELYKNGIQYVNAIWDNEYCTFLLWDEAQIKFKLTNNDNEDWTLITSKIIDKWTHLLGKDPN